MKRLDVTSLKPRMLTPGSIPWRPKRSAARRIDTVRVRADSLRRGDRIVASEVQEWEDEYYVVDSKERSDASVVYYLAPTEPEDDDDEQRLLQFNITMHIPVEDRDKPMYVEREVEV